MSKGCEEGKNAVAYVLFALFVILTTVCLLLVAYFNAEKGKLKESVARFSVVIDGQSVTGSRFEMDEISLTPGKSTQYALSVSCEEGGRYALSFTFEGNASEALINCVRVEIVEEAGILASVSLAEALGGRALTFSKEAVKGEPLELTVRYVMSVEAGNETQGASADLDVILTAQKA